MMPKGFADRFARSSGKSQRGAKPDKTSRDFVGQWGREFKSIGWGQEIYEQKIRKRLQEQMQLEEGELLVFAASSGGWLVWVQGADDTEAGLAHAMAGTNRRLIIWTSRGPDFALNRFRELRYRDLAEVRELAELRIGKNVHKFDGLISVSLRENGEELGILVGRNAAAPLLGFLKEASAAPATVEADPSVGGVGPVECQGERREMAQESLLQMLEGVATKVRLLEGEKREAVVTIQALEREKREAAVRIQALERENSELTRVISLASAKVDEILKGAADAQVSQPKAVNVSAGSTALEQLGEFSADSRRDLKERSSRALASD